MEPVLLVAVLALFLFFIFVIIFVKHIFDKTLKDVNEHAEDQRRQPITRRMVSGAGVRRRQRRLEIRDDDVIERDNEGSDVDVSNENEELAALRETGKIGTKKLRKLEEKAEKRARREATEIERQERKEREEMREEERKRQESRRHQEEAEKEAREELLKLEQKKQEEEEYQRLKESFVVEEEGKDTLDDGEAQNLLQEFIAHVKESKIVMLEDLATKFHLKTQEVIERVRSLQEVEVLTGVMDDRGKFIYITQDEYEAVARFIKQRGRVSIAELSESINQVICLHAKKEQNFIQIH